MSDFGEIDYFRDMTLIRDPFPYFDYLREHVRSTRRATTTS